jgi:TRAP-type C4-dicarboxylate transport system permease small subunit
MSAMATAILFWGSIHAGFISIFYKNKRFAHKQNYLLRLFANVIFIGILGTMLHFSITLYGSFENGIKNLHLTFWTLSSYWDYVPEALPDNFIFIYIYSLTMISMSFSGIFALLSRWKPDNPPASSKAPETQYKKD